MENELRCDEQIYLTPVQLCFFRSPQSPPDYSQIFGTKKYFAVYAAKQYYMTPGLLEIYSVVLLLLCYCGKLLETYKGNMKGNIIRSGGDKYCGAIINIKGLNKINYMGEQIQEYDGYIVGILLQQIKSI
eukprot:372293_1